MDILTRLVSDGLSPMDAWLTGLLLIQLPAAWRLLSGLRQALLQYPNPGLPLLQVSPPGSPVPAASVSIIVPTLNEVHRLTPCLTGLIAQTEQVREILVVDSRSKDGTRDLVRQFQQRDPRLRLLTDDPLPPTWVGRPWALHWGFLHSSPDSEWILGLDADTEPAPGLVQSLLLRAEQDSYDLVSLSPRFIMRRPGESWLHPALLITLLYRTTFSPRPPQAERVLANGQCFLCRRSVLMQMDGYTSAASSFCDDVTLARNVARAGYKVGFLDGSNLLRVRMYDGVVETWREWGRSLDLKDASSGPQLRADLYLLAATQALPLPVVLTLTGMALTGGWSVAAAALLALNGGLLVCRLILLVATAHCFDRSRARAGGLYWLSPLLDPLAVLRVFLSALHRPTRWRGRVYATERN
jgi:dolichol-phosphate mannosyltransferase